MSNPNGITLEQAIDMRNAWLGALNGLTVAQEYTITNGNSMRKLQRSDLKEVQEQFKYWSAKVVALTPNSRRIRYGVPF